jgi:hypothetical protein
MKAILPVSTMRRIVPLIKSREQFRIRTRQLLPSIKAGTNGWLDEVRKDENLRQDVIIVLLSPNEFGDGTWRTAALEQMKREYPGMVYSLRWGRASPPKLSPEEHLSELRAVLEKDDKPWLRQGENPLLIDTARQFIRRRKPRALLKLYGDLSLTGDDRIWLIGEAAILMSGG